MADEAETLDGFLIRDVAVVDRETFAFTAIGDPSRSRWTESGTLPENVPARVIAYLTETDFWGYLDYTPSSLFKSAGGTRSDGRKQACFASTSGSVAVFNFGADQSGHETDLPRGAAVSDLRFIDGQYYAVGGNDFLGRREAEGTWTVRRMSETRDWKNPAHQFIDGYGADDLYLLPENDLAVLHGDGQEMTRFPFPEDSFKTDQQKDFVPLSMCAAPDGTVYIGGNDGRLIAGRAPSGFVQMIPFDPAQQNRRIHNLVWFQETLWATFGAGLARLVNGKWEVMEFPGDPEAPTSFRYMDARDGVLLVAGESAGWYYNGEIWRQVFGISVDEILQIKNMEKNVEGLQALIDSAKRLRELRRNAGR
ncbi:MAG: hypothetical protein AAFW64_09415 [Pseudomonadota bacterium]